MYSEPEKNKEYQFNAKKYANINSIKNGSVNKN